MSHTKNQKSKIHSASAFTLVELIVVIVILSILATISFLSFSSYSSSSRDSVRLGDITSIAKGLTLQYSIGGSYIIPDNSVSLLSGSTTIIGYQGKAGYNTLNSIKLSTSNNNSGKDPLDNTYYTYNINSNKNKYQLSGFLENKGTIINRTSSINNLTEQTYATTYTNRYPYMKGDSIGVILSSTGGTGSVIYLPLEDSGTGIDVSSGTQVNGKIVINNNTDSSTGVSVVSMSGYIVSTTSSSAGTCGSDNGQTVATTPINLCTSGTPSSVVYSTGMGQYAWSCGGASCKAYDNYNVLLLHFDGNLTNNGSNVGAVTNNNSVTLNSAGKFGNAAGFNGSNYLTIPNSVDWNFGSSNFTIDAWVYLSAWGDGRQYIYSQWSSGAPRQQFGLVNSWGLDLESSSWCTFTHNTNVGWVGGWHHMALVRNGNTVTMYKDGYPSVSNTCAGSSTSVNSTLWIGSANGGGHNWNGYIDELRVSKGIARWTADFSGNLPSSPY